MRGEKTKRHGASYWGNVQRRNNKDDVESVQESLDNYIDEVNNIIHLATVDSGCLPHTRYKPRPC